MRKALFFFILFVARAACAQTGGGVVAGNVVDEQGKPMEYATVAVLDAADSAYVAGGLTDAEGRFSVNVGRTFDGLMLRVTSMGYAEKYEALPLSGPVRMRQKSTALGEVTVTGARKYVKTNATGLTVSMVFYILKGGLLGCKRMPFACLSEINENRKEKPLKCNKLK